MSAFWCVFWWVLLGFLLGWLCNWLLCRRLSGGDGRASATQAASPSPSSDALGEGSGMNWQTQMVDISRRTSSSTESGSDGRAGSAASQSSPESESESTDDVSKGAGADTVSGKESEAPTAAGAVIQRETAVQKELEEEAAQEEVEGVPDSVAGSSQAHSPDAGSSESGGAVQASTASRSAAPSLFASEKPSKGKTFAGIDSDTMASAEKAGAEEHSGSRVQGDGTAEDRGVPAPVFAAVVNVNDELAANDMPAAGEESGGAASEQTKDRNQSQGACRLTADALMSEQQGGGVAVVALDLTAARAAGFSVRGEGDLTVVEGIGPKISRLFKDAGILTLAELGRTPTQRMQEILDAAGPRYRLADPTTWGQQAGLAADNRWSELKAFQDTLDGGRLV